MWDAGVSRMVTLSRAAFNQARKWRGHLYCAADLFRSVLGHMCPEMFLSSVSAMSVGLVLQASQMVSDVDISVGCDFQ